MHLARYSDSKATGFRTFDRRLVVKIHGASGAPRDSLATRRQGRFAKGRSPDLRRCRSIGVVCRNMIPLRIRARPRVVGSYVARFR
jgi:hypothetical protein